MSKTFTKMQLTLIHLGSSCFTHYPSHYCYYYSILLIYLLLLLLCTIYYLSSLSFFLKFCRVGSTHTPIHTYTHTHTTNSHQKSEYIKINSRTVLVGSNTHLNCPAGTQTRKDAPSTVDPPQSQPCKHSHPQRPTSEPVRQAH